MIHYITFCYIISQTTQADNPPHAREHIAIGRVPSTVEIIAPRDLTNAIPVVYYTLVGYLDTETLEVEIHADL
jgi:hypothetical protein